MHVLLKACKQRKIMWTPPKESELWQYDYTAMRAGDKDNTALYLETTSPLLQISRWQQRRFRYYRCRIRTIP